MTPAKSTAVKPTTIETRAPKMSRDSTSRPRWSVPSRCSPLPPACQAGGRKRAPRRADLGIVGREHVGEDRDEGEPDEDGDRHQREALEPRRRSDARGQGDGFRTHGQRRSALQPDARVDHGVEDVDQQVDDDDHGAAQQHRRPAPPGSRGT